MDNKIQKFCLQTLLGEQAFLLATSAPLEDAIAVHGDLHRLAELTDIPMLRSPTMVMDAWDGMFKTVRAWSPSNAAPFQIHATREQLRTLYEAGFTILLENVERFVPGLRPLCRILENELGIAAGKVNVQVFCALEGGRGRAHFDRSFTFNCQIIGTKTWTLAKNTSLRFPSAGMFLGNPPVPEIEHLLSGPLPDSISGGDVFVAKPGSVVFLPPGVLHETHMETASFAIAFAIEETDTVANHVARKIRTVLQKIPALRAPRLGAQSQSLRRESLTVAEELRRIADMIEAMDTPWWIDSADKVRLRQGLSAEVTSDTSITLRGPNAVKAMTLDPMMVHVLGWASRRGDFHVQDIALEQPNIDPHSAEGCVRTLIHIGLMERVA